MIARFVPVGRPRFGSSSAVRARMPPSPWLSARITNARYLIEMMTTQRPEHDRRHAVGVGLGDVEVGVLERLPERVQRAGADVAVDDPQRAERQRDDACVPSSGAFVGGHDDST